MNEEQIQDAEVVETTPVVKEEEAILIAPEFRDKLVEYLNTRPAGEVINFVNSLSQASPHKISFTYGAAKS